jgi:hypothetical protein
VFEHRERPRPWTGDRERLVWGLAGLALLADLLTTLYGLRVGLAEANPLVRTALSVGPVGFLGLKLVAVGVALACRPLLRADRRAVAPAALALVWGGAALANAVAIAA